MRLKVPAWHLRSSHAREESPEQGLNGGQMENGGDKCNKNEILFADKNNQIGEHGAKEGLKMEKQNGKDTGKNLEFFLPNDVMDCIVEC